MTKDQAKRDELISFVEASEKAGEHKKIRYGDCEVLAPVSRHPRSHQSFSHRPRASQSTCHGVRQNLP